MKTTILVLLCFIFLATGINAKNDPTKVYNKKSITQSGIGSLLGQMMGGMKNSAFSDGKAGKKDLISQIGSIGSSDYVKYASVLGSFAGALKGTSFLPAWASQKDGVLDKLQQAGSIADIASGASGILGMLNPGSMSGGLKKNKSTLSTALGLMSMIK